MGDEFCYKYTMHSDDRVTEEILKQSPSFTTIPSRETTNDVYPRMHCTAPILARVMRATQTN